MPPRNQKHVTPKPTAVDSLVVDQKGVWIGLNLYDFYGIEPSVRDQLRLAKRLDTVHPIRLGDEVLLRFLCPLIEAALVCDIIRSHYPARVYLYRRTWSKLSSTECLAISIDGKAYLNPNLFKDEVIRIRSIPPKFKGVPL